MSELGSTSFRSDASQDLVEASECLLYCPGIVPYQPVWRWQQQLVAARRQCSELPDALLLLEHWPIYTLGKGANQAFVKASMDASSPPVLRVERGGEVTYHCPGQLIGYPILNLQRHQPDLHWYLRRLEDVLIETLRVYGIAGDRVPGLTGVWVDGQKVAAIGIKVSRWITMHGFALNVCPDLSGYEHIVPCGISDKPVGSLAAFQKGLTVAAVQKTLEKQFQRIFHCRLLPQASPALAVPPQNPIGPSAPDID